MKRNKDQVGGRKTRTVQTISTQVVNEDGEVVVSQNYRGRSEGERTAICENVYIRCVEIAEHRYFQFELTASTGFEHGIQQRCCHV